MMPQKGMHLHQNRNRCIPFLMRFLESPMILLAAVDLERAINLLVEQEPHHLMREGHR